MDTLMLCVPRRTQDLGKAMAPLWPQSLPCKTKGAGPRTSHKLASGSAGSHFVPAAVVSPSFSGSALGAAFNC